MVSLSDMVDKKGIIKAEYIINGQHYKVIETKIGEPGIWNAKDTILNTTNGKMFEKTRREWFNIFNKYK